MSLIYLSVRYMGILYSANILVWAFPVLSMTDMDCKIIFLTYLWATFVINSMLWVIMIVRLHVMYQRTRKMFIFLIATFMVLTITCGVSIAVMSNRVSSEELVLSGTYECTAMGYDLLSVVAYILMTLWEVLVLCLASWIAVKHFRELRQRPAGSAIGDCVTVLIKYHMFYFTAFVVVVCFTIGVGLSPKLSNSPVFSGILQIATSLQFFVLGPRLVLSVRDYYAELLVNSEAGTGMSWIQFQDSTYMSTGDDV